MKLELGAFSKPQRTWQSNQRLHACHSNRLAGMKRLAVANANRFAPVGGFIAKLVQKSRRLGRASFDELAVIAANRRQLLFPVRADVEHERGLRGVLQV